MMKMVCVIYNGVLYVVELVGDGVICLDMGWVVVEDVVVWLLFVVLCMIFVFGLNYVDYVKEFVFNVLIELLIFLKGLNMFVGYWLFIVCLVDVMYMYYECELVVVIGCLVCCVSCV